MCEPEHVFTEITREVRDMITCVAHRVRDSEGEERLRTLSDAEFFELVSHRKNPLILQMTMREVLCEEQLRAIRIFRKSVPLGTNARDTAVLLRELDTRAYALLMQHARSAACTMTSPQWSPSDHAGAKASMETALQIRLKGRPVAPGQGETRLEWMYTFAQAMGHALVFGPEPGVMIACIAQLLVTSHFLDACDAQK